MEDVKEQCDDTKTDVPSSSSSKDLSKSLSEEAFNNFLQGKRHMLVQDYQFAVQSLGTACELYVKHFGELAIECGEVYFLYGKALFRLSQQQAGILGGALNEGSNEEENSSETESKENESEKNSDQEGGEDNSEDNNETEEADIEEKEPSESTDSPQAIVDEATSEAKAKEEDSSKPENVKADTSTEEPPESMDASDQVTSSAEEQVEENPEAEEDDLELAWNTLEAAKSIFKRQDTVESQLKVAEILQLLSEISMESDNNVAAINDLRECLEIQKKHLKPDDRILAETYYQMGLAQLLDKQYNEALDNFRTTKSILELRRENLKNTPVDESAGSFASADKDAEISDLENILLDIQEKIEDTEELIRNTKKELEDAFASGAVVSPVKDKGEPSEAVKPISNITHLLKRKKPDEVTIENDSKRIKISPVPNGETKVKSPETIANAEGGKVYTFVYSSVGYKTMNIMNK